MKQKKLIFAALITILFAIPISDIKSQTFNRVGVYDEEHTPARKVKSYYYLQEADVMWKKRIWRIIDLREKINQPLYFPVEPIEDRMSLISLILRAQQGLLDEQTDRVPNAESPNARLDPKSQKLPIVQLYDDELFKKVMTISDVESKFGVMESTQSIVDPVTGEVIEQTSRSDARPDEVIQWLVKEDWFFNKIRSSLDVRIIGICAIRQSVAPTSGTTDPDNEEIRISKVFWAYFPEIRPLLSKYPVFNFNNDAERRTFDDIFQKRMFNSFISQESNVFNDRPISDYELGIYGLWEAENIKNRIFDFEQDLWVY